MSPRVLANAARLAAGDSKSNSSASSSSISPSRQRSWVKNPRSASNSNGIIRTLLRGGEEWYGEGAATQRAGYQRWRPILGKHNPSPRR